MSLKHRSKNEVSSKRNRTIHKIKHGEQNNTLKKHDLT